MRNSLLAVALLSSALTAGAASASDLFTLQGPSFVDVTRSTPSALLNVGDDARGTQKVHCGLLLRSNQPYAFTSGLINLAGKIEVNEHFNGVLTPDASGGLGIVYRYTSRSAYGTDATISTKGGESLADAVAASYVGTTTEVDAPRVIVTLIPCTR